jgi:hypothetical protein
MGKPGKPLFPITPNSPCVVTRYRSLSLSMS